MDGGSRGYVHQNQPVLKVGPHEINPLHKILGIVGRLHVSNPYLGRAPRLIGTESLRLVDFDDVGGIEEHAEAEERWSVEDLDVVAEDPWVDDADMTVWVDEGAEALIGRQGYDSLERRLAAVEGIDRVVHEDRETFHVSTRLSRAQVESTMRRLLREGRPHGG